MIKTSFTVIKEYFNTLRQPVTMTELKSLSQEDKDQLATEAAKALGYRVTLQGGLFGYTKDE